MNSSSNDRLTEIQGKVVQYLTNSTALCASDIDVSALILGQSLIDSLQLIELIVWIEGETGQPVEIDEIFEQNDTTVARIAEYIGKKTPAAEQAQAVSAHNH